MWLPHSTSIGKLEIVKILIVALVPRYVPLISVCSHVFEQIKMKFLVELSIVAEYRVLNPIEVNDWIFLAWLFSK